MAKEMLHIISAIPCMVTGEKNSPTAAHAGRKRTWTGPPGWGVEQQATCHPKQAVRKPNCGLRTVRLSGINQDNGKG